MYFDPDWIFENKPEKNQYPNITGLMVDDKPKKPKKQKAEPLTSLADVFKRPEPFQIPQIPQVVQVQNPVNRIDTKDLKRQTAQINYRDLQTQRQQDLEDYKNRLIQLTDPRTTHPITGQPMNPNSDMYTGKYDPQLIIKTFAAAKEVGVDPWGMLATALKETSGGNASPLNIAAGGVGMVSDPEIKSQTKNTYLQTALALKKAQDNYRATTQRIGVTIPEGQEDAYMFQEYNGWGVVDKELLKKLGYGDVNRWQGVDISQNPLDPKVLPAHGLNVVSLRDALRQDPKLIELYNQIFQDK